jgi:hypothetical protein
MTALDDATIVRLRSLRVERTPQRLDPLGVQSAWALVPVLSVFAVGYALYSTLTHLDQSRDPVLGWLAFSLVVVVAIVLPVRAHPGRAPVGLWTHVSVIGTCVAGASLFSASVWGGNNRIQDDWGQIVIALLLVAMALYRPVPEVLAVASVAALIVGVTAVFEASFVTIGTNPLVYFTVAATPIIALACGGCGYAWTMTGETLAWRELARSGQARLEPELLETARRMVNQERITSLNEQIIPFLADLLQRGEVTPADTEAARAMAMNLRDASVAAVDRTWLGETLAQALSTRGETADAPGGAARVDDPHRLERSFSAEQRAVVGAIIATVAKLPGLDAASVRITATNSSSPAFELRCGASDSRRAVRRELIPFMSALRSIGMKAGMRYAGGELSVRFSYPEGENR